MSVSVQVGDTVEMTCDLVAGVWTLRKVEAEDDDNDEIEVEGVVTGLSPLTVGSVSCVVPVGMSVSVQVGDTVEMTCDRVAGVWTLRKVELEDDDDDNSGPGGGEDDDDDDDDNSGPGGGDDDDDDDDNSGPGGGDDDDDDD